MSTAIVDRKRLGSGIERIAPWAVAGVLAVGLVGYVGWGWLRARAAPPPARDLAAEKSPPPVKKATVELSPEKLAAAHLGIEAAGMTKVTTEAGVTGLIGANADRQVEVRPRAAGIVREARAVLGQSVRRGDVLAVLDSPDVGLSRLNLRSRQRELEAARYEADWKSEIARNVALLIPVMQKAIADRRGAIPDDDEHFETPSHDLTKRTDTRVIEKQFADRKLGTYRGLLLQAYADFDIACHEEQKTASLRGSKIMGEHLPLVARHTREGVEAKLESAIEQARFDAAQQERLAQIGERQAEAGVIDAVQRLLILGVDVDMKAALSRSAKQGLEQPDQDVDLTAYPIKAPFDGTIISRTAVTSQKADLNDVLFVLADLTTVWVKANVSESDLGKLPKLENGLVKTTAVAYPGRVFTAKLLSVGSVVDPNNRTVPILAQTENREGALKIGMFMRIVLDSKASEDVLTVPSSAVQEIDAQACVFAPDSTTPANHSFTCRPVETGRKIGERVEIKAGLLPGDPVVGSGAFLLKSELVLQNTPEEE